MACALDPAVRVAYRRFRRVRVRVSLCSMVMRVRGHLDEVGFLYVGAKGGAGQESAKRVDPDPHAAMSDEPNP